MLPWEQQSRRHSVSFVMYISGAKFEEHCSNISGDIFDSVFYCLSGTINDVITFLICITQKREYLYMTKNIPKKKMPFFFTLKSLSNNQQLLFYFISTLS